MKKAIQIFYILLIVSVVLPKNLYSQITRGAQPDEIFIATDWYADNTGMFHRALFHSENNGKNLDSKYETLWEPPPGEMRLGKILGDATTGVIYNYGWYELWVSFDYGETWTYKEEYTAYTKYFTGTMQGLIFKGNFQGLFKSTDYASNFVLLPITVTCPFTEVGFSEPEFYGVYGEAGSYYNFVHTIDYGQTYTEYPLDSTVAFWQMGGYFPRISRGAVPGEIYLISWWPDYHYKIFHSSDTGYTWTEKYESGYIDIYYWGVTYTAGRKPGSFYVLRGRLTPSQTHTWLYIDYSNDYGETFTTYFHDLDSLYTSVPSLRKTNIRILAFPNPFKTNTTFSFQLPEDFHNHLLNIYDPYGKLIKQFSNNGKNTQIWDGTDKKGNRVKNGMYFFNISYVNFSSQFNKLLIIN